MVRVSRVAASNTFRKAHTCSALAARPWSFAATLLSLPAPADAQVTYVPGRDTTAAFQTGKTLLATDAYQVHASRRDKPGEAEVHAADTDIMYILDGTATIVTGGAVVGGKTSAPRETRGASITGGTTRTLAKGDVIVIPHGTPHQFTVVDAPLTYYVVKIAAQGAP